MTKGSDYVKTVRFIYDNIVIFRWFKVINIT